MEGMSAESTLFKGSIVSAWLEDIKRAPKPFMGLAE
jgi:hypothetical protein